MKHFRLNLNLTSVIVIIAAGVLLPVMLSTAVGIVAIALAEGTGGIVTGVLIISFTVTAAGCGLLALVFTGRKARLARQQADFVANISHEFRTPLSAIRLYAQTLQSGKLADDPEETSRCIATILRETTWLDVMIDRMLTWRASSKDMMELNIETKSVSKAVYGAIDRFNSMVPADELTLSSSIKTELRVQHDAKALNAVVLNLLTNAYKYTGRRKEISVTAQDRDNHVIIEVKDNGIGLTATEMKHIFQPFYRAERRNGGETGGVGLGLAIARHQVNQHKGTISVSSHKDEGSSFTISLPSAESSP
jgi:two-component system phosphate regulon sensor histidine kinase PhoR